MKNDAQTDLQAVLDNLLGKPIDESVKQRVQERSKQAQEELVRKHGVREIAVELIRQGRDE